MAPWSVQMKQTRHRRFMRMLCCPARSPRNVSRRCDGGTRRSDLNELSGEIPSELGGLSNLFILEFSSNELSADDHAAHISFSP